MSLACCCRCIRMAPRLYSKENTWRPLPFMGVNVRCFLVSAPRQKVAWPKSDREALIRLNRENLRLYGPVLKSRKKPKTREKVELSPETLDASSSSSSSGKPKKRSPKKSPKDSAVLTEKSGNLMETAEASPIKKLVKPKKSSSKLPGHLPVHTPRSVPLEPTPCESVTDLALPANWEVVLSDFISKQTLIMSDYDLINNNMAYKNILNLLNIKTLPSVTSILNKTLSPTSRLLLQRWKTRMIREMGRENFRKYQEELKENGSNFHLYVQRILAEEDVEESDLHYANEGHWQSLQSILPMVTDACALETQVTHQNLLYRGMFDCVANYEDVLCLIDWKTSLKHKPLLSNTYDNPVQVAAYISALNTSSLLDVQITNAVIVVAYPDGSPADAHFMNEDLCHHYWQEWKRRLIEYWTLIGSQK